LIEPSPQRKAEVIKCQAEALASAFLGTVCNGDIRVIVEGLVEETRCQRVMLGDSWDVQCPSISNSSSGARHHSGNFIVIRKSIVAISELPTLAIIDFSNAFVVYKIFHVRSAGRNLISELLNSICRRDVV
jgi:hypothetical protein